MDASSISDLQSMESKINEIVEMKLKELRSKEKRLFERNALLEESEIKRCEEEEEECEADPLLWNMNAMAMLCWKGWDWPHNQRWNEDNKQFEKIIALKETKSKRGFHEKAETQVLKIFMRYIPIILAFLELTLLAGITDEGSTLKRMIYGDGYFQVLCVSVKLRVDT